MEDMLETLNRRRDSFLNTVQDDVHQYVPHFDDNLPSYCKVLSKFTQQRPYHGHDLDSDLTAPICAIVEQRYIGLFEEHKDEMADHMMEILASPEYNIVLESFLGKITDVILKKASSEVRAQVVHIVMHQIHASVQHGALHTISHTTSHAIATTAGTTIAVVVTNLLLHLIGLNIKTIVAKVLASTALQHFLAMVIKKVVYGAVAAAVLQFCGAHVIILLGPFFAFYLYKRIKNFPKMLGAKVAQSVRDELATKFESNNKTVIEKVLDEVLNGNDLAECVANDKDFKKMMQNIAREVQE